MNHVEKLYVKAARGELARALAPGEAMRCSAGLGIDGDVHANRLSPRQVLVTSRAELDALSIEAGALFENIVVSLESDAAFKPGAALVTQRGVEIWLTMYCEPCQRIAGVGPGLGAMVNRRGILGRIVGGGQIAAGDSVRLIAQRYPALPEPVLARYLQAVASIPQGRVARYLDVTIAMGVDQSFVRAIPGYIKRSAGQHVPSHRIVDARGRLPAIVPGQAERLEREGVRVQPGAERDTVDLERYLWRG